MEIVSTKLLADEKTVLIHVRDLRPAMQMRLQFRTQGKSGEPIHSEIYHTINAVP